MIKLFYNFTRNLKQVTYNFLLFIMRNIIYIVSSIIVFFLPFIVVHILPSSSDVEISDSINKMQLNHSEYNHILTNMQLELEERTKLVEQLKAEAEITENFISLSSEQVDAIRSKLRSELELNGNKSLLQNAFISALFFILGLIYPKLLNLLKNPPKYHKKQL